MNKQTLETTIKTMEAYLTTNREVLEGQEITEISAALDILQHELRNIDRTIMVAVLPDLGTAEAYDISEFCRIMDTYENEYDPSILQAMCTSILPEDTYVVGYGNPMDTEYWKGQAESDTDYTREILEALKRWLEYNK